GETAAPRAGNVSASGLDRALRESERPLRFLKSSWNRREVFGNRRPRARSLTIEAVKPSLAPGNRAAASDGADFDGAPGVPRHTSPFERARVGHFQKHRRTEEDTVMI